MTSHLAKLATAAVGVCLAALPLSIAATAGSARKPLPADGIVRKQSAYPIEETVKRLRADIEAKGIVFFDDIEQSKLAAGADITPNPSHLLVFGNPALGTQFLTADADAGLDWPVRLLVYQDANGQVWTVHTDFNWIARRHHIKNRKAAFDMANKVITSITSSVAKR